MRIYSILLFEVFPMLLKTLSFRIQRSSEGKIIAQAKSELLILKTYNVVLSEINDSPRSGNIDNVSREILKMTHPVVLTEYNPLETGSDGNCLYRAVSRGLFGHEQEHERLRLLTATEFILNRNVYDENSWDYTDFISDCRVVTSPYRDILKSAVTNGAYAELIHMYAISAVLGSAIRSY